MQHGERMVFPFNLGFMPKTMAEDGDPIDMLILNEEPLFPGCLLKVRPVAVMKATQTEDGKPVRNDRLIGQALNKEIPLELQTLELRERRCRLAQCARGVHPVTQGFGLQYPRTPKTRNVNGAGCGNTTCGVKRRLGPTSNSVVSGVSGGKGFNLQRLGTFVGFGAGMRRGPGKVWSPAFGRCGAGNLLKAGIQTCRSGSQWQFSNRLFVTVG